MGKSQLRKSNVRSAKAAPASPPKPLDRVTPEVEHDLLKRLWQLEALLRDSTEVDKVLSAALKLSLEFFRAPQGCVPTVRPGRAQADIQLATPASSDWDRDLLAEFLRGQKVNVPADTMLARVRRNGRMWGALALRAPGADFHWDTRKAFSSVGALATQIIERVGEQRIREVRNRIDHKILEQIGPKDLFYQILHGLRSLVGYDHSAALLICDLEQSSLELVGEQIAWRKAKSPLIGLKLPLDRASKELLTPNTVYGFNLDGKSWRDWTESDAAHLARLLDFARDHPALPPGTAEGAMLVAPLVTRHGVLGVLKISAVHPGTFGAHEAQVVSQFLPQVAVALQNHRHTESLEMRMRAAERKQAMADLARAVSHDVNNALGAIVPLVQQMQDEVATGAFDAALAADDLAQIERSLQLSRRIFGGMLAFARGAARHSSEVFLHHELSGALAVFREGLERRGIEVIVNVPADLPPLVGIQADIDQLLLNLLGNARDAIDGQGQITLSAARVEDRIELSIADNGRGIAPAHMAKIQEPFFTTKSTGNGLGLSICRSIVSQMRGRMQIESTLGVGTTVRVSLPLSREEDP